MKKLFSLIVQTTLVSGLTLMTIACHNPLINSGSGGEIKPPTPPIKDVDYFQNLIKETAGYIKECFTMLAEIQASKKDYQNEQDYQSALDEVTAEQYSYQSLVNEYQYQILLLAKQNNKFTPEQIIQGITIFTAKIGNLEQELKLKVKYPDYYSKQELQVIKATIVDSRTTLKMFEKLKEENK